MKINTNSWHYRLNSNIYGSSIPKNLCPYFWGTILSVVFLSWFSVLFKFLERQDWPHFNIGLLNFLGKHSNILRYSINAGVGIWGAYSFFGLGSNGGLFLMALGTSLTIFSVFSKWIFKTTYSPRTYTIKEKNPNILVEMVKAKHHRMCPRLEFVDVEKENFNEKVRMINALQKTKDHLNISWNSNEVQDKKLREQDKTAKTS